MAIQKMCFVTVIGPVAKFDGVVEGIVKNFAFHPENSMEVIKSMEGLYQFTQKNEYYALLKQIEDVVALMGIEEGEENSLFCEYTELQIQSLCKQITEEILNYQTKKNKYIEKRKELEDIYLQLKPLETLKEPIEHFMDMKYVNYSFGKLSQDNYNKYKMFIEQNSNVIYIPTAFFEDTVWGFYFSPNQFKKDADSLFQSLHFQKLSLPKTVRGIASDNMKELDQQMAALCNHIKDIDEKINTVVQKNKNQIMACYNKIKSKNDIFEVRNYCIHSEKEFYLTGWITEDDVKEFKKRYESDDQINYIIEQADQLKYTPPTKLKNIPVFRPFEEFVKMYGLPSYGEFDPTPFMAVTYLILFGIMFGDLGQGFLLLILGLILSMKKNNLGNILIGCGGFSMIFGLFYGSVFGYEDILPGFKALENSTNINITIMASIAIGMALVSIAMFINIYNGIKQKNIEKVFFHYNGISGFVFYWGVIIAILAAFGFGKSIATPLYIAFVIILPLILIYLKEPLSKLAGRQKDWKPKNIGEYLVENIFELFEVVLSYVTNTVSFMRVGAFALNHAGMMLAVFILSRMFGNSENVLVIIFGNLFVMAMEGLIVGIQVLRLEFYEMFSRFFTGEGKAFVPLAFIKQKQ